MNGELSKGLLRIIIPPFVDITKVDIPDEHDGCDVEW